MHLACRFQVEGTGYPFDLRCIPEFGAKVSPRTSSPNVGGPTKDL